MVHVAHRLWADMRQRDPDYRILGLKADCRAYKYAEGRPKCFRQSLSPFYSAEFSPRSLA